MKFERMVTIICLLLIFTVGAVSASDINETSHDLLCSDESLEADDVLGTGEGSFSDIQTMIDAAGPGDTITLSKDFIGSGNEITVTKQITIDGNNCTLDAKAASRILSVSADNVVIKNLKLINGKSDSNGGAVQWTGSSGVILNCRFADNQANDGGALYYRGANGIIQNSAFSNNSAYYNGAVYMNSLAGRVIGCTFTNNRASNTSGALGWVNKADGLIEDSVFSSNTAPYGGAMYVNSVANLSIRSSQFNDNTASRKGAAVYWEFGNGGSVISSVFTDNKATRHGGAIYFYECDNILVYDGDFTDCSSSDDAGGAIYYYSREGDNVSVSDCRFMNCSAVCGGAVSINSTNPIVSGCSFTNCHCEDYGGAIYYSSVVNGTISDCTFLNCSAEYYGGAVCAMGNYKNHSSGSIFGCGFRDCSADIYGGAIYLRCFDGSVSSSSFMNCSAEYNGGAIGWDNSEGIIENSSFINNYAETGRAISATDGVLVRNSKFIDPKGLGKAIDADYDSKSCTRVSKLETTTALAFEPTVALGENISITVRVLDQGAVIGGVADLFINGELADTVEIGKRYYFAPSELGEYNVSASFDGDSIYNASESLNMTFEALKPITKIAISAPDIVYGEDESVAVTVSGATGNVTMTVLLNDKVISEVTVNLTGGAAQYVFSGLTVGVYRITVDYPGDSNRQAASKSRNFTVRPVVNITQDVVVGDTVEIEVNLVNATGLVNVIIDGGAPISGYIVKNTFRTTLPTDAFSYGDHEVTFQYVGNSLNENVFNRLDDATGAYVPYKYLMHLEPIVIVNTQDTVGSDDAGVVILKVSENATGWVDVSVYVDGYIGEYKHFVVEVIDGVARIDLSEFKDGNYRITFTYSGDSKFAPFTKESLAMVHNDVPSAVLSNDVSMVYTSATPFTAIVLTKTGKGLSGVSVSFSLNGKYYGSAVTNGAGVASIVISAAPGSYVVTSSVQGLGDSKTLKVTHVLSLKKVTVKKSAKKLVLTATLKKVNGKYLKNKKITFKFNGKKYTAKTSKKGVAKVTIKSKVLKKLKVGKKVVYQATYLKDTVKYSLKVKK